MVMVVMMHHDSVGARNGSEGGDANDGNAEGEEGLHNFCGVRELKTDVLILR